MPRITVPILKFIGTVSLGLLTGISYTHAHLTAPTLLTLPSATTASTTFSALKARTTTHSNALLVLSISSYSLAYALSPPKGGRHPYLLWTSLLAGMSWGLGAFMEYRDAGRNEKSVNGGKKAGLSVSGEEDDYVDATHSSANIMTPTSGSEDGAQGFGLNDDGVSSSSAGGNGSKGGVNGEGVRSAIERFAVVEGWKRGVTGLAFLMGVVGIWGDGVGVRG